MSDLVTVHSRTAHFAAQLRPKELWQAGFCPIAEGNLIGKPRYVRSLKGCEQ